MGKFNLNDASDFGRVTQSDAGNFLLRLTGLSAENWDIEEASYGHEELVPFHVFKADVDYQAGLEEVVDDTGRRLAIFDYPYQDGQSTEDLGRKAESYDFKVILHGKNYKQAYNRLRAEINDPRPGTLLHPIRGRIRAKCVSLQITNRFDSRNAMILALKFVEHTFDVTFEDRDVRTTKSVLASALSFLATIDAIRNKIDSIKDLVQTFKTAAQTRLRVYREDYAQNLQNLNRTFNRSDSDDLPGLLPTNQPLSDGTVPTVLSPNDPFANLSLEDLSAQTTAALAAQQAQDEIARLRRLLNDLIAFLISGANGLGGLIFYDDILELKRSAIAIQDVLEVGLASSKTRIIQYTVPRLMTLREVCFENGLSPDQAFEVEQLNPSLLSTNYVPAGTVLTVSVAA